MSSIYYVVSIKIMGYWVQKIILKYELPILSFSYLYLQTRYPHIHCVCDRKSECECVRGTLYVGIGDPCLHIPEEDVSCLMLFLFVLLP